MATFHQKQQIRFLPEKAERDRSFIFRAAFYRQQQARYMMLGQKLVTDEQSGFQHFKHNKNNTKYARFIKQKLMNIFRESIR